MLENILLPFYLISAFSTLASALNTDEADNQHEFGLCPESHPTAFDSGRKCCSENAESFKSSWSSSACSGSSVDCSSPPCEDLGSSCEGYYPFSVNETLLILFSQIVEKTSYKVDNRPIYQSNETCMWWHRAGRNWWIGSCEDIGSDSGYAYLKEDLSCPDSDILDGGWRKRDTDGTLVNLDDSNLKLYFSNGEIPQQGL